MNRLRRSILTALAVVLGLVVFTAQPAFADSGGTAGAGADHHDQEQTGIDNAAVAINTKDGSDLFRFAFSIVRITGDVAAPTNTAIAYASCKECQTVAIAIQIVLIEGSPSTYTPQNVAIAVNDTCSHCDTLATAYQYVFQSGGPMTLTEEGWQQLREVLRSIRQLKSSGLTGPEIQARVDTYAKQIYQIFSTQLVPMQQDEGQHQQDQNVTSTSTLTTPSTTTSTTAAQPKTTTPTSTSAHPVTTTSTTSSSTSTSTSSTTPPTTTTSTSTP